MKPITVNFCVKNPESYVKYNQLSSIQTNIPENFPIEINVKEVMKLSKKQKKEYKKIAKAFLTTLMTFPMFTSKSMAAGLTNTPSQPTTGLLIPPDFLTTCMTIIVTVIVLAVVAAIICMILAGVMRMFKQKKFAIEWTSDIIHGFAQILIAVPLILFLFLLTVLLFKNLPIFSGMLIGL